MATDYGTDLAALDDLPETDQLVSGELNAAYAVARRWLTPSGGLSDAGDTSAYESFDVREYLGRRLPLDASGNLDAATRNEIEQRAVRCAKGDVERVRSATVSVTFSKGMLSMRAQVVGADGPFTFVLEVTRLTAKLVLLEAA